MYHIKNFERIFNPVARGCALPLILVGFLPIATFKLMWQVKAPVPQRKGDLVPFSGTLSQMKWKKVHRGQSYYRIILEESPNNFVLYSDPEIKNNSLSLEKGSWLTLWTQDTTLLHLWGPKQFRVYAVDHGEQTVVPLARQAMNEAASRQRLLYLMLPLLVIGGLLLLLSWIKPPKTGPEGR